MTERPGQPANGSPTRGRHHRSTSSRNRAITILALVVAIVAAAGLVTWLVRSNDSGDAAADTAVTVAAAPDIAEVVTELAGSASAEGCPIEVQPTEPADFAEGDRAAAIWIPDSSMWIATAESNGMAAPVTGPSIATSPLVLALPTAPADRLAADGNADVADILA